MSSPSIALFANHGSPQIMAVRDALVAEGATPLIFNIQLGGTGRPTVKMAANEAWWEGVDFRPIQAVHIRCTAPNTLPAVPPRMNAASYAEWRSPYLREQEYQATAFSFFNHLVNMGKLVVNPLTVGYTDHDSKGQLYMRLRAEGYPVPDTLTTNDPAQAEAFLHRCGQLVVKPAIGVGSTRLVREEDKGNLAEITQSPVLLQECIVGHTLRVHVVGQTIVLALRIFSEGGVDSRTRTRDFEFMNFPPEEGARLVAATRSLGLHYAAWDVIEGEDGRLCYLDCNPGPFVMWIGPEFVKVVFRQLARYLIAFSQTASLEAAAAAVSPWRP